MCALGALDEGTRARALLSETPLRVSVGELTPLPHGTPVTTLPWHMVRRPSSSGTEALALCTRRSRLPPQRTDGDCAWEAGLGLLERPPRPEAHGAPRTHGLGLHGQAHRGRWERQPRAGPHSATLVACALHTLVPSPAFFHSLMKAFHLVPELKHNTEPGPSLAYGILAVGLQIMSLPILKAQRVGGAGKPAADAPWPRKHHWGLDETLALRRRVPGQAPTTRGRRAEGGCVNG